MNEYYDGKTERHIELPQHPMECDETDCEVCAFNVVDKSEDDCKYRDMLVYLESIMTVVS